PLRDVNVLKRVIPHLNCITFPHLNYYKSTTYSTYVGITWVILDYFRLGRLHFSYILVSWNPFKSI
ncbi:MAG: hypothetical protein ACFFCW_37405, partial [Candidatus Hodarchaeota archaeon]